MNTLLAILNVTDARRDVTWQADCTADFLGDTSPPAWFGRLSKTPVMLS